MGTTNARFLLGILVGLFFGGGLVYLVLGPPADAVIELGSLAPGAESPSKSAASASVLSAPTSATERREVEPSSAPARVSDATVARLVNASASIEAERLEGQGVISGRVIDEAGAGVPGVVLRLEWSPSLYLEREAPPIGLAAPEWDSIDDAVRETAEAFEQRRVNRHEQLSDATGSFRFEGLMIGNWWMRAYLEGYDVAADSIELNLVPDVEVELIARRVVSVPVDVVEADGSPAANARLECTSEVLGRRSRQFDWTPEEPFVRVPPGALTILAYSTDRFLNRRPQRKSESLQVELAESGEQPRLRLVLREMLGIRGRVILPQDDVKSDMLFVTLVQVEPGAAVDLELLKNSDQRTFNRAHAPFDFYDLQPGHYAVGVSRGYRSDILVHRVVEVVDGVAQCDLELPPTDFARCLRVTVLDANGASVSDANLSVVEEGGRGGVLMSLGTPLRTASGQYVVELPHQLANDYFDDLRTDKQFQLRLNHQEFGRREWPLARGTTEMTVTLALPATLSVTVPGYRGSEYVGRLSVQLGKTNGDELAMLRRATSSNGLDADGAATFDALEPGSYRLTLTVKSSADAASYRQGTEIDALELEIASGENRAQLTIPPLYALRVHWADGKEGTSMRLMPSDSPRGGLNTPSTRLDANGNASFEDLRAGDYVIAAGGGSSALRMFVTVPCKDVEFVAIAVDALRVEITDPAGSFASVGLEDGDLIVGVDGAEFTEPPNQMIFSVLSSSKSARLTLIVERAGKRVEILVRGSDVGQWGDRGADFHPVKR